MHNSFSEYKAKALYYCGWGKEMTQARTERSSFLFAVKEYADGTPWICAEPRRQEMPILEHAFIGFGLPNGTTLRQAHAIADYMNEHLANVSMTLLDRHPMFNQTQ